MVTDDERVIFFIDLLFYFGSPVFPPFTGEPLFLLPFSGVDELPNSGVDSSYPLGMR